MDEAEQGQGYLYTKQIDGFLHKNNINNFWYMYNNKDENGTVHLK